jgi:hypothetical protein
MNSSFTGPAVASYHRNMGDRLPLSAQLSQALVAFTIEFDNEFEHLAPHRTTTFGPPSASVPWLVSMPIWIKFLRFVPDRGIRVEEFQQQAALTNKETKMWLTRLSQWWGYVVIETNATEDARRWLIRPTSGGQKALKIWRRLTAVIEKRWHERFSSHRIHQLCCSLQSLADQLKQQLPDSLPILGYDMLSKRPDPQRGTGTKSAAQSTLPALLSKVLFAFASQFEHESGLSLAIGANVLRVASEDGACPRPAALIGSIQGGNRHGCKSAGRGLPRNRPAGTQRQPREIALPDPKRPACP